MDSVYKLSKYSQKIYEACRAKQLNKVMEYNKHELAYINKLSKYFGNQKGGADTTIKDVVDAVGEVLKEVADKIRQVINGKDEQFRNISVSYQTLEKELRYIETTNSQLRLKLEEVNSEFTKTNERLERKNEQLDQVALERNNFELENITLKRQLPQNVQQTQEKISNLEEELKQTKAQLVVVTKEKEHIHTLEPNNEFVAQLEDLRTQLDNQSSANVLAENEIERLKRELTSAKQEADQIKDTLLKTQQELEKLAQRAQGGSRRKK
jgi:chromosome segregation ATPase